MVESEVFDKIMPMEEAVKKFVRDGDLLSIASTGTPSPYAAIHEIVRQKKRNLTLLQAGSGQETEILVWTGCAKRFIASYQARVMAGERAFDRGLRKHKVEVEEFTNYTVTAMQMAGALGLPCFPAPLSLVCSDIYRKRTFMGENKIVVMDNPFKPGEKMALLPSIIADVSVVHVQRVDKYGNAQAWGGLASTKWGALCGRKIIVSAEEMVEHEVVKFSPNYTIIPSYKTSAIVIEPWGAHATDLTGYYDLDMPFGMLYYISSIGGDESFQAWLDEWVYGVSNRTEYLKHYSEKFGPKALDRLRVKYRPSSEVNYGGSYQTYREMLGITDEMMEKSPDLFEIEVK
jgi:glutaconate CoA-transferase subunit A